MIGAIAAALASASVASFLVAVASRVEPVVRRLRDSFPPAAEGTDARSTGSARTWPPLLRRLARMDRLEALLGASGASVSVGDVMRIKVLAGAAVLVCLALPVPGLVPVAVLAGAGAFIVPDLVVARMARRHRRRGDAEVPQFLDLLAAASSAGLAGPAAIDRAAGGLRGPLADELTACSSAVQAGARWREELLALASRLQLPDLAAAVTVITRSERLGSSLAANLRLLADEVRDSRRARAAERARTAPVKMLFPLVFMVLPAFLLLTVVPVLIATIRSLD